MEKDHFATVIAAISAKIVKDKNVTSISAIKDNLENAGAIWLGKAVYGLQST